MVGRTKKVAKKRPVRKSSAARSNWTSVAVSVATNDITTSSSSSGGSSRSTTSSPAASNGASTAPHRPPLRRSGRAIAKIERLDPGVKSEAERKGSLGRRLAALRGAFRRNLLLKKKINDDIKTQKKKSNLSDEQSEGASKKRNGTDSAERAGALLRRPPGSLPPYGHVHNGQVIPHPPPYFFPGCQWPPPHHHLPPQIPYPLHPMSYPAQAYGFGYMYPAMQQPHVSNTASQPVANTTSKQPKNRSRGMQGKKQQRGSTALSSTTLSLMLLSCLLVFVTAGNPLCDGGRDSNSRSSCSIRLRHPFALACCTSVSSQCSPPSSLASSSDRITVGFASSRRDAIIDLLSSSVIGTLGLLSQPAIAATGTPSDSGAFVSQRLDKSNFRYRSDWTGTALPLLSIEDAAIAATTKTGTTDAKGMGEISAFRMGRWPDPILRRPASPIRSFLFGTSDLHVVAEALRATARKEGAVGLAAQQCGVDGRLLWIDTASADTSGSAGATNSSKRRRRQARGEGKTIATRNSVLSSDEGLFLINPRITRRSDELDMLPWTETCLVLPPSFTATVLRDASITVQYESLEGETLSIDLDGELARCVQHESDHDRGILILDHVDLSEMEDGAKGLMAALESEGHGDRMLVAYGRYIDESSPLRS
mmetsp:Transcript_9921/g.22185  ORF Transcript_9921/g.22185 Transcript_9921/m.22185 type:complete len:651 (+) Transcript_9921:54-2006(+)